MIFRLLKLFSLNSDYTFQFTPRRNVGIGHLVSNKFFIEIITHESVITEDHVNAYVSILATRPNMVGINQVINNMGITSCEFVVRICIYYYLQIKILAK